MDSTKQPIAVMLADVHYERQTLEVADRAVNKAIDKAKELKVPVIVAGDLHSTKADMRGEIVKRMIQTFSRYQPIIILRGNHDQLNEKSEEHSLEFLRPYSIIVDQNQRNLIPHWTFIPYQHDPDALRAYLKTLKPGTNIIMHQGVKGLDSGEYIQDRTAIDRADLSGFRVVSGHYHNRQHFELPDNGSFDYIGNPFTLNFGEARDLEKGFQILYDDGTLEFVPTKLRRHVIVNYDTHTGSIESTAVFSTEDIVRVGVFGPSDKLAKLNKSDIAGLLQITQPFRLDMIQDEVQHNNTADTVDQVEILDGMIESFTPGDMERTMRLKELWRMLVERNG